MTISKDRPQDSQDDTRSSFGDAAARRGADQRKESVDPAQNPAPSSPQPDRDALEKGEETLERVKPY